MLDKLEKTNSKENFKRALRRYKPSSVSDQVGLII